MKISKYLIIFFIIFLILFFLILVNYLFKEKNKKITKNEFIYITPPDNIESFSNNEIKDIKNYNNLIKNGNFKNGVNSPNHVNQNGYNKIILLKNPGVSSYVLEQKKTDNLTYYDFICDNQKNSKYILYFWLSIFDNTNNEISIDELDFEKLINVKIQNEDFSNYIPKLNYNIIQKVSMADNENTWYLIKYNFISGGNTMEKMQLYFNYSENLQYDIYYFADISLYRVLADAENFIYNNQLICYLDGYHYESNTPTFHDLSGNGNDMFWSNIPIVDYTKGSISTLNYKLIGIPANKLSNTSFTISFCLNKNFENIASNEAVNEENSTFDYYLISIPGNDRYSFEIKIKNNFIYLVTDNIEHKSNNEVILYNKCLVTITYNDGIINIYQDGINILSKKIKKVYFSNDNILINKNKNLNCVFYSILLYNRVIDEKELNDIREYFITNQNKNFNTPDINNYHMNQNATYTQNDNFLFKPFNNKVGTNNILLNNTFIDKFDNQTDKIKKNKDNFSNNQDGCIDDCNNLCKNFINTDKYEDCINNCKNVLMSCQNYCDSESNEDTVYCNNNNNSILCPKVYKKNNNYMVYIPPNSYYSNILNYSGERSYGQNLEKARYTYNLNFPKCSTPTGLIPGGSKNYIDTCPYIINESNPCYTNVCGGVNWGVDNHENLNLNKKCKKIVSNYCHLNYNLDDKCMCWNPINKDDPVCLKFKRYFEDPNDYCSPHQFKIEEHPDFDKYIKKDSIPCWGCNLSE